MWLELNAMSSILIFLVIITLVTCNRSINGVHYDVQYNTKIQDTFIFSKTRAESKFICAVQCSITINCWTSNFNNASQSCQMSKESPQTQPNLLVNEVGWIVLSRDDSCGDEWVVDGDNRYLFVEQTLNWFDAQHYCKRCHSQLVEIDGAEKNSSLKTVLINRKGVQNGLKDKYYYWTGGYGNGSHFMWSSSQSPVNFTDWDQTFYPGMMNYNGFCIQLRQIKDYQWDYIRCNQTVSFVCERPVN